MRVQVTEIHDGLHPSEIVVEVGGERFPISRRSLSDGTVEIGYPVGQRAKEWLVEMPAESQTGCWRVWVPKSSVF